jgi:hypothetical protein
LSGLRLFDPATGDVREVTPAVGRVLRIAVADGVRVAVVADVLRRLSERARWQTSVLGASSLSDRQLLYLNVHPFHDPGPDGGAELAVCARGAGASPARAVEVGAFTGDVDPLAPPDGADPLAVRLALLAAPYRQDVDLDPATVAAAAERLRGWRALVAGWAEQPSAAMPADAVAVVAGHLQDDLNSPAALDALDALAADSSIAPGARFEAFAHLDRLLGLDLAADVGRTRR